MKYKLLFLLVMSFLLAGCTTTPVTENDTEIQNNTITKEAPAQQQGNISYLEGKDGYKFEVDQVLDTKNYFKKVKLYQVDDFETLLNVDDFNGVQMNYDEVLNLFNSSLEPMEEFLTTSFLSNNEEISTLEKSKDQSDSINSISCRNGITSFSYNITENEFEGGTKHRQLTVSSFTEIKSLSKQPSFKDLNLEGAYKIISKNDLPKEVLKGFDEFLRDCKNGENGNVRYISYIDQYGNTLSLEFFDKSVISFTIINWATSI